MSYSDERVTALSPDDASSVYNMLWGNRPSPATRNFDNDDSSPSSPSFSGPCTRLDEVHNWSPPPSAPNVATTVDDFIIHFRARRPGMIHTAIEPATKCDSTLDLFPPLQSNITSNGNLSTSQFSNSIATKRKPVAAPTTTQFPGDSPLSSRVVSPISHSYSTGASSPYTPMLSTHPPSSTVDSHPHSPVYSGSEPHFDPKRVRPPTIESVKPTASTWERSYPSNPSSQDFTVEFGPSTSFNPVTGHSRLDASTSAVITQTVHSAFATLVNQTGVSSMNVSLESGSDEKPSDNREPFSFEVQSEETHFVSTGQ